MHLNQKYFKQIYNQLQLPWIFSGYVISEFSFSGKYTISVGVMLKVTNPEFSSE